MWFNISLRSWDAVMMCDLLTLEWKVWKDYFKRIWTVCTHSKVELTLKFPHALLHCNCKKGTDHIKVIWIWETIIDHLYVTVPINVNQIVDYLSTCISTLCML